MQILESGNMNNKKQYHTNLILKIEKGNGIDWMHLIRYSILLAR